MRVGNFPTCPIDKLWARCALRPAYPAYDALPATRVARAHWVEERYHIISEAYEPFYYQPQPKDYPSSAVSGVIPAAGGQIRNSGTPDPDYDAGWPLLEVRAL